MRQGDVSHCVQDAHAHGKADAAFRAKKGSAGPFIQPAELFLIR